jgi:sulfate transport system permease protein
MARRRALPGFGLTMGYTLVYLSLVVLVPLATLIVTTSRMSWSDFVALTTSRRAIASYELTFGAAAVAAVVNAVFGTIVAWALVRYRFPCRGVIDALVDVPFALPTAVAGLALVAVLGPHGWLGRALAPLGVHAVFSPLGVTIALTFIGLPFVVRTVQPVLEQLDPEAEEAAAVLGATRAQTFVRVIVPALLPAIATGFALALARAIGEYGSLVFISGNKPLETEVTPLLIMTRLEQYDYAGATALALVMLIVSLALLLAINGLGAWARRRAGEAIA